MKRIGLVAILVVTLLGAGPWVPSAGAGDKPPCCKQDSKCAQGIQRSSCCVSGQGTVPEARSDSPVRAPLVQRPAVSLSAHPLFACNKKAPQSPEENPPEQAELYLLDSAFLI